MFLVVSQNYFDLSGAIYSQVPVHIFMTVSARFNLQFLETMLRSKGLTQRCKCSNYQTLSSLVSFVLPNVSFTTAREVWQ